MESSIKISYSNSMMFCSASLKEGILDQRKNMVVSVLLLLTALCSWVNAHSVKYVITTPQVARSGLPFTFSASLTENAGTTNLSAEMVNRDGHLVVSSGPVQLLQGESKSITINIPTDTIAGSHDLRLSGSGDVSFTETTKITIKHRSSIILVQTDKGVYKPGDKVNYRTVVLTPTLKPKMLPMTVEIDDPNLNKISVVNIEPEDLSQGVYTGELQLSKFPPEGEWKIIVSAGNTKQEKAFKVEEYILPKYEVKVDVADYFIPSDGTLLVSVSAKYAYGQPVKGKVHLVYTSNGGMNKHTIDGELKDGVYSHTLDQAHILWLWCDPKALSWTTCPTPQQTRKPPLQIQNGPETFPVGATSQNSKSWPVLWKHSPIRTYPQWHIVGLPMMK